LSYNTAVRIITDKQGGLNKLSKNSFLNPEWLLNSKEAVWLYQEVVLPLRKQHGILDLHTHLNLQQILDNQSLTNIWKAEVYDERYGNRDHYLLQLAAKFPPFSYALAFDPEISEQAKWSTLGKVFPFLEGNHVHQWLHLDLKRVFGIEELLGPDTADRIWNETEKAFQKEAFLPLSLLRKINARVICTTDDPCQDLAEHKKAREAIKDIVFLPTFRPDPYCNIFEESWRENVERICALTGEDTTLHGLVEALRKRHAYFAELGARASDHGLLEPWGLEVSTARAEEIFNRAYEKREKFSVRSPEVRDFISYMMHRFCEMNAEYGMATQIHFGALRDTNVYIYKNWGKDMGGDAVLDDVKVMENLLPLLNKFFSGESSKSYLVLYTMNHNLLPILIALSRTFPNVQIGFPWWFNDAPSFIEEHLLKVAHASCLSFLGGPVADSRKILSEGSRFEVFDRMICRVVGKLLSEGQISQQGAQLIVRSILYDTQKRVFNLQEYFPGTPSPKA